jgi:hypothetical protein
LRETTIDHADVTPGIGLFKTLQIAVTVPVTVTVTVTITIAITVAITITVTVAITIAGLLRSGLGLGGVIRGGRAPESQSRDQRQPSESSHRFGSIITPQAGRDRG